MGAIWMWIIIAVIFGIICGLLFHIAMKRMRNSVPTNEDTEDNVDTEISNNGNLLLSILVFSILVFLVIWLVCAVIGVNMHW